MKTLKSESGQTVVFVLLSLVCVLGFVALAVDVGTMLYTKRQAQAAADAAAIAGAAELNFGNMAAAGEAAATQNGFTDGSNGTVVTVTAGPAYGAYQGNPAYVEAVVTQPHTPFFMQVLNLPTMNVGARAVATNLASQECMYLLGAGLSLNMVGPEQILTPGCGIVDNGSMAVAGGPTITANSIGVAQTYATDGSGTITPTPIVNITPVSDPLAYLDQLGDEPTVPPTCADVVAFADASSQTLVPGCYASIALTGSGTYTFQPGVYIIDGGPLVIGAAGAPATVNGTGVTFYLVGGAALAMAGAPIVNLSAPITGTLNGMLIWQDEADLAPLAITAGTGSTLNGIVYAPSAAVAISGAGGITYNTSFVVNSLATAGTLTVGNYNVLNPGSDLTSTRLVE